MAKIYTKTGDEGKTSLLGGIRTEKCSMIIDVYGTIDELNSSLGVVVSHLISSDKAHGHLLVIQRVLFDMGALFATDPKDREKYSLKKIVEKDILSLENWIDEMTSELGELTNFILPGGSVPSSFCHVSRTVCRRLERLMVELNQANPEWNVENSIKYTNRLSDYLFTASRYINFKKNIKEINWH